MDDPNPVNSGRALSVSALQASMFSRVPAKKEARRLNEPFACWIRTKKPFVTLKSAMTLDGQLALPRSEKRIGKNSGKRRRWITSEESRAEVHRMRHASDALLTGIGTILADDPSLTDRSGLPRRKRLLRAVLDSKLHLSAKSRIVKTSDDDLLVFTTLPVNSPKARKLQDGGAEVIRAKAKNGRIDLSSVLFELGRREILGVLLEAGPLLNGAALAAGIVHKLFLFYAPTIAGENRVPFALAPKAQSSAAAQTFARSSSAPILLWKPTCTTFYVDLFGRQGHTFCKGFSHSVSRDCISARRGCRMRRAANSIPGLSLFWITGSGPLKNTTHEPLDRRSRLCPLPDILLQRCRAWFQSGGGSAAFFPVRGRRDRRSAKSRPRIRLARWRNGASPCRTTTVCGITGIRPLAG